MDTKSNLSNRKKINELAIQHNKLTTLVACLLNEIGSLKRELMDIKNIDHGQKQYSAETISSIQNQTQHLSNRNTNINNNTKFPNFNELRAEDILKHLSINNSDN